MREHYQHALSELERHLDILADHVRQAVHDAMWALEHQAVGFAQQVIAHDNVIDNHRYLIEQAALNLIARQQPIARDLRVVSAILGLASELERIGDYAEGIAEIVLRCVNLEKLELPHPVRIMAQHSQDMLKESLEAFRVRDETAPERLHVRDDYVDALYTTMTTWAFSLMQHQPEFAQQATYYLWVGHNLERIADRTVNICEKAAFIATGNISG